MISRINELKTLKQRSCKYKFDGRGNVIKMKKGTQANVDVSAKIQENMYVKKLHLETMYMYF